MDDTYPYPYPPKHRRPFPTPPPQPDSDEGNYLNSTSSSSSSSDEEPPQNQQNQIDSSPEILLKRRRVDRYDQDFEFVARTKAPTPVLADWSKESTFALIEAWGDRFLSNGRRKLHSDQWAQVVRLVNEVSGTTYSELDCRKRVEMLKKRYEKEKARVFGPNSRGSSCSKWVYFAKMDELMGTARSERRREREMPKLRFGVDNGEYVFGEGPGDTGSEGDDDDDGGGGRNGMNDDGTNGNGQSGYGVLADSVKKFGEVCERMESNKKRQAKELESMRMEFQMELESRKREILDRVQSELANIEEGYDDDLDSDGMDRDDGDDGMDDDGDDDLGGNLSD
ncbi:trihelix transcription factor ENAP2-like [Carex rostrata]